LCVGGWKAGPRLPTTSQGCCSFLQTFARNVRRVARATEAATV
jgi:hypothetical protein